MFDFFCVRVPHVFKLRVYVAFCLLILTITIFGRTDTVRADSRFDVFFDDEGNLVMTSNDRAAAGTVGYKTVGWTVKKDDRPIGETLSARVNQVEYSREADPADPTRVITTYKVSEDKLFERIEKCDASWAKELFRDGGIVWLDAIMTVVSDDLPAGGINEDGSVWGTVYFTADAIKNAENWADPDSLDSHFGKKAFFEGDEEKLWGKLVIEYYEMTEGDTDTAESLDFLGFDGIYPLEGTVYEIGYEDLSEYGYFFLDSAIYCLSTEGLTTKYCGQPVYNVDNSGLIYERVVIRFYFESEIFTDELTYTYGKDHVLRENKAALQATPYGDPMFDAETAIPSGEMLCAEYTFQRYYINVTLKKYSGTRPVPVTVYVWHFDDKGRYRESEKKVWVAGDYSYFRIERAVVFSADSAVTENGALSENVIFSSIPAVDIKFIMNRGSYVRTPDDPDVCYITKEEYEEGGEDALKEAAQAVCEGPEVRNDLLTVDGFKFLNGGWTRGETAGFLCPDDSVTTVMVKDNIKIPVERANGKYTTTAHVLYQKRRLGQNGRLTDTGENVSYNTADVNDIFVHTPVVCFGDCSDDRADNQQYVPTAYDTLVLGKSFSLKISETGEHIKAPGYGQRNYAKYSGKRQARLPFAVYYGDKYVLPYTWVSFNGNIAEFYLPVGVEEGDYEIEYRVIAVNSPAYDGGTPESAALEWISERNANLNSDNTIAFDELTVTVTGRIYDIAVTGVEDYPRWWPVFYSELGVKRGVRYRTGSLSMEGKVLEDRKYDPCVPVMERFFSDKPHNITNLAVPGAGYVMQFELKTVGSMRGENDGIVMLPRYYHISRDGRTRTEVKIYSRENLEPISTPVVLTAGNRSFLPVYQKNVIDTSICERSVQLWSGRFRLPDDIYAVSADVNLTQYIKGKAGRLRQDDSIFLKGGYILVQFDILSMQDGAANLSYINSENAEKRGCCNMWKRQGFAYVRGFADGSVFKFTDGDMFLFDMEKTINTDYESMGTH